MASLTELTEQAVARPTPEALASETSGLIGAGRPQAASEISAETRPADLPAFLPGGRTAVLLFPANRPQLPARRLVVLVPDSEVDEAGLAACIWALAAPRGLAVLLLGTQSRSEGAYRARRRLATLAAITRDERVQVDSQMAAGGDWRQAVMHIWRPGDLVVCHQEMTTTVRLRQRPLAQALFSSLVAPIYVISGFYSALAVERSGLLRALRSFLPPVIVILGCFWLQAQVTMATAGGLQTILLILTVIVEFSLILAWEQFEDHLQ
jgi:hypothetical protein